MASQSLKWDVEESTGNGLVMAVMMLAECTYDGKAIFDAETQKSEEVVW